MFDRFHSLLLCVLIRQLGRDSSFNRISHTQRTDGYPRLFFSFTRNRFAVSIASNESIDDNLIDDDGKFVGGGSRDSGYAYEGAYNTSHVL